MPSHRLAPGAAVLCLALAAGATACGGSKGPAGHTTAAAVSPSPSPGATDLSGMTVEQISKASKAALGSADSVRLSGSITSDGTTVTFDVSTARNKDCDGTFTLGSSGGFEVVRLGASTWLKPDAAFWQTIATREGVGKSGAAVADLLKGHYLTGAQDDPNLKDAAGMCDLIDRVSAGDSADENSDDSKGAYVTVNGQRALTVEVVDDKGGNNAVYIAAQGPPYPLRMVNDAEAASGGDYGQVDFLDYNKPLTIQAPPADLVIDRSKFQQQAQSV